MLEENKGNFKAAIIYYEKSVSRDSTFENGYFNLAAAYANIKDFKKANINILKVLELNPNAKDAREMHEHIIQEILRQ
jgi:tetratricopeptide (TPR) repeat protein